MYLRIANVTLCIVRRREPKGRGDVHNSSAHVFWKVIRCYTRKQPRPVVGTSSYFRISSRSVLHLSISSTHAVCSSHSGGQVLMLPQAFATESFGSIIGLRLCIGEVLLNAKQQHRSRLGRVRSRRCSRPILVSHSYDARCEGTCFSPQVGSINALGRQQIFCRRHVLYCPLLKACAIRPCNTNFPHTLSCPRAECRINENRCPPG